MFVEERQAMIMALLREEGRVKVKDLSQKFQVTEDLIRKDLTVLEEQGILKKAYGGAVLNRINVHLETAVQRKDLHLEEKKAIAKKAISLIKEKSVIFLDISTINVELAILLSQQSKNFTVVTNMIDVMRVLSSIPHIKLIFIGGELDYGCDGFVGSLANEMLHKFSFDIAFIGAVGIDVYENTVSTYMPNDGLTKKEILTNAKVSYVVCETKKFEQTGSYKYAQLTDVQGIICEHSLNIETTKQLSELGVPLYL